MVNEEKVRFKTGFPAFAENDRRRVLLQPAYVLHRRSFRETSLLIDLLTRDHGRVTVVARGAKQPRSPLRSILHSFMPLLVSWSGKGDLYHLNSAEMDGGWAGHHLWGPMLLSGFYLNELLIRILQHNDPQDAIYPIYQQALSSLSCQNSLEKILRLFEKRLLAALGYALPLQTEAGTNEPIVSEKQYRYDSQHGFIAIDHGINNFHWQPVISGASLLAFHAEIFDEPTILQEIKRITRTALTVLLGEKPLRSRALFLPT